MKNNQDIIRQTEYIPFNPKELNRIGRNDKAFTLQMLKLFLTSARKCGRKLKLSLKQHNWNELKSTAHKNIPTYLVMGLNELADFLKYIEENALKKDKHKSIEGRIRSLYAKNSEAIEAVQKYVGLIKNESNDPEITEYNHFSYAT